MRTDSRVRISHLLMLEEFCVPLWAVDQCHSSPWVMHLVLLVKYVTVPAGTMRVAHKTVRYLGILKTTCTAFIRSITSLFLAALPVDARPLYSWPS